MSLLACLLSLSFSGCSGGGGGASAPVAPVAGAPVPSNPTSVSSASPASPAPPATPAPPGASAPPAASPTIQHVIIVFQENRTPDNLFQGLPGADIATSGTTTTGATVPLAPMPFVTSYDIDHSHAGFLAMYHGGRMDGADTVRTSCGTACPFAHPQYGYVPPAENAPYMALASRYTFADRMFQTNQGPSYPAHQYIIAGTSQPSVGSALMVSENTTNTVRADAGCDAPSTVTAPEIDPSGSENHTTFPCFEHPVLMDLLDAKGISWKYYTPRTSGIWVGPNSIAHIRNGPDWSNVVTPQTTVLTDIASGKLPAVSWVIPSAAASDHPLQTDGSGPSWVTSITNAVGQSAYWKNTVVIVTWDDWGGWYDHVAPPKIYNSYEFGFRVPLIVVSPYARHGYVSHVTHEFGSILHFVENNWKLGTLGYTDARADDLSDCFDFSQTVTPYVTVPARLSAAYFVRNPKAETGPDGD